MSEDLKLRLRRNGSTDHVIEFGKCTGIVGGPTNFGGQLGPEVDVRWQPDNLRYAYHPDDLVVVS
jgi:hypothetical protein